MVIETRPAGRGGGLWGRKGALPGPGTCHSEVFLFEVLISFMNQALLLREGVALGMYIYIYNVTDRW